MAAWAHTSEVQSNAFGYPQALLQGGQVLGEGGLGRETGGLVSRGKGGEGEGEAQARERGGRTDQATIEEAIISHPASIHTFPHHPYTPAAPPPYPAQV